MDDNMTATRTFAAEWEKRIGSGSDFERQLTPESRKFYRMLTDEPVAAVRSMMEGLTATVPVPVATPSVPAAPKSRGNAPAALFAPAVAAMVAVGGCFACDASGWIALPVVGATVAVASAISALFARRHPCAPAPQSTTAKPEIAVDDNALRRIAEIFQRQMEAVTNYVKDREQDAALGFDVTDSKSFAEWIQKFVDHANRNPDSRALNLLKEELVSKLLTMGISVYDELTYDAKGEPLLPDRDSYRDERPADADKFSTVRHAIVSSRRRLLAPGELA